MRKTNTVERFTREKVSPCGGIDMIQLKIKEDNNLAKYISLIRKYNNRLISIEYLDNRLNSIVEIEQETLSDIDRELGG